MFCCGREEERQGSCVQKICICEMLSSRGFLVSAAKSRERNSLKDIKLLMTWNHCDPKYFQWTHLLELCSVVLASCATQKKPRQYPFSDLGPCHMVTTPGAP